MKNGFGKLLISFISIILLLGFTGVFACAKEAVIYDGVYADNIPLGGLTYDKAKESIDRCVEELSNRQITLLTVDDQKVIITPKEVGFAWKNTDILDEAIKLGHTGNIVNRYKEKKDLNYTNQIYHIEYSVNHDMVIDVLTSKCTFGDNEAVDGFIVKTEDGFEINGGQTGHILNIDDSARNIEDFFCNQWTGENATIQLDITTDDPSGTYEQLSKVDNLLGAYHTSFKSSGSNRSANVRNGARLINENVIYPGEEYSFYDHIKPFTSANGYQMAAAYSAGKVVDSIGGGICQVSSTLYNAVLYAELEIVSRRNHAMIVGYVEPARDATISEASGIDFIFKNNTDAPIYIEAYTTDEKELYINIYGHETRPEGREVEYKSEILSKTVPDTETIYTDYSLPVGKVSVEAAHIGYKANLWKIVTENGETTKELVNTSSYTPVPKYATVGMATSDPTILAVMEAAVASGSINTVKAAAANCAAGVLNTPTEDALAQYQAALKAQQAAAQ